MINEYGGKRGRPWIGLHWASQLRNDIKTTLFPNSWRDAVKIKDKLRDLAMNGKKFGAPMKKKKNMHKTGIDFDMINMIKKLERETNDHIKNLPSEKKGFLDFLPKKIDDEKIDEIYSKLDDLKLKFKNKNKTDRYYDKRDDLNEQLIKLQGFF